MTTQIESKIEKYRVKRPESVAARLNQAVIHEFILHRHRLDTGPDRPLPRQVTLVFVSAATPEHNQLFVDRVPIPRKCWTYNAHDRVIRWKGLFGGGTLWLKNRTRDAFGQIGRPANPNQVSASGQTRYVCNTAINCGVGYKGSEAASGLTWNTESDEWQGAQWVEDRLILGYTTVPEDDKTYLHFTFTDTLYPEGNPSRFWDASAHTKSSYIYIAPDEAHPGSFQFNLHFEGMPANPIPMPPPGGFPEGEPKTLFPLFMDAAEPSSGMTITGAMNTIFPDDINGELVGFQGKIDRSTVAGYYQTEADKVPFAVFGGALEIGGHRVSHSHLIDNTLYWNGLSAEAQKATGLAQSGSIQFNPSGTKARTGNTARVSAAALHALLDTHAEHFPERHRTHTAYQSELDGDGLSVQDLEYMSPFLFEEGTWNDKVQERVRGDFADIAMTYIPDELWDSLFSQADPPYEKPVLDARVAEISITPLPDGTDPKPFYESLSTAFLTQGMAGGSNENCKNMNGPRAEQWLRDEVSNSDVYHYHCQLLFDYHWPAGDVNNNKRTPLYLTDQENQTPEQLADIDEWETDALADIEDNVVENENSVEDLKKTLSDEVRAAAAKARDEKLYWAFALYSANTTVAALTNIEDIIFASGNQGDSTSLSRYFQDITSTLTALDPSGYYAKLYNATVSTFLGESILNTMYDFDGDLIEFDLIWAYLNQFVEQNLNNPDPAIAELARQINSILTAANAHEIIHWSINSMVELAHMINFYDSLFYVGGYWPALFGLQYPDFAEFGYKYGGLLATGMAVGSTFGLYMGYKSWDELSTTERGDLVTATVDRGLQVAASLTKRGVYMGEIFTSNGLSKRQRAAGAGRQLLGIDKEKYYKGLTNLSSGMARWLSGSAGSFITGEPLNILFGVRPEDMRYTSRTKKVFGRNLDEFVSCRVGPVLAMVGMGFTIAQIIESGETGAALAADVISLVATSLELFALVGGWMIEGGLVALEGLAATMIALAGPLAVVCAIVGFGLMLYLRFRKQPDPVEEFVNDDVAKAGFKVEYQCAAIDYASPYVLDDGSGKSCTGFSLSSGGQYLNVNQDGIITLGTLTHLPDSVWVQETDGYGVSRIGAIEEYEGVEYTTGRFLTLLSDNSVVFLPPVPEEEEEEPADPNRSGDGPDIVTQYWVVTVDGEASTVASKEGTSLSSMSTRLAAVPPDAEGEYHKENAQGGLQIAGSGVNWSPSTGGTTFQLKMETLAPNFFHLADITFLEDIQPMESLVYGPSFGITPSVPFSIAITPELPPFLYFDPDTNSIRAHGEVPATGAGETEYTAVATNWLGSETTTFKVIIREKTLLDSVYD
ncbi:MAG: hypothetical protein AAGN35_18745 [Bacteroidota bacterium]